MTIDENENDPTGSLMETARTLYDQLMHSKPITVFNYDGTFSRAIGGIRFTNYPISVRINSKGELIVADNYTAFNLTIFDQKGNFLEPYKSCSRIDPILDMTVVDDGMVAVTTKDSCKVLLYRYKDVVLPGSNITS